MKFSLFFVHSVLFVNQCLAMDPNLNDKNVLIVNQSLLNIIGGNVNMPSIVSTTETKLKLAIRPSFSAASPELISSFRFEDCKMKDRH